MIALNRVKEYVTRRNKDYLKLKYKRKTIIYFVMSIFFLLLFPFNNLLNYAFHLMPNTYNTDYELAIHILDTGQGSATIINLKNEFTIMYDTGLVDYSNQISRYINNMIELKDGKIDCLILSHVDSDHTGNALKIYNEFNPSIIYLPNMERYIDNNTLYNYSTYYEFYSKLISDNVNFKYNNEGEILTFGNLNLKWLSPNRDYYSETNLYSPIIKLTYKHYSMLLTGDSGHNEGINNSINTEREAIMYAEENDIGLDVDTLIAGHHGSKYSTSLELLNAITPNELLISVGENNYNQPSEELYANIIEYDKLNCSNLKSKCYTTLDKNNIVVFVDDTNYYIDFIEDIDNYIFVQFFVINIIILIPIIYTTIDSFLTIRFLNRHRFGEHKKLKKTHM